MQLPRLNPALLSSTVGCRILFQFVLCAVVPIVVLAGISFSHVRKQLNDESQRRLRQESKSLGLTIYERLLFLEAEMRAVAASYRSENAGKPLRGLRKNLEGRFKGFTVIFPDGRTLDLAGKVPVAPPLSQEARDHIRTERTLLSTLPGPDRAARIVMIQAVDARDLGRGLLMGDVEPDYLWSVANHSVSRPTDARCVLGPGGEPLTCWPSDEVSLRGEIGLRQIRSATGEFAWGDGRGDYLARFWSIPMKYHFYTDQWTVVFSASKADIFAGMAEFKRVYPMVLATSLLVVVLLSIRQIQRSLLPLERLKEGARRVAGKDFNYRVEIDSGDEFQELAQSFNDMTRRLGRQFNTLANLGEIDRAILSELEVHRIVETVVTRWQDLFSSDFLSVSLLNAHVEGTAQCYLRENKPGSPTRVESVRISREETEGLDGYPAGIAMVRGEVPGFLAPLTGPGVQFLVVLPIRLEGKLLGMVCLGYLAAPSVGQEELQQARQLADQLTIAIDNSQLYEATKIQAERLARANRVKNEFLSVMSHELRTPLTIIMGLTETMRDGIFGQISPHQEKPLVKMAMQSHDLLSMINAIIDATALESEAMRVETEEFELSELLDDLRSSAHVSLVDKRLAFRWNFPADRVLLRTDRNKVKRILQSLIHNAIKFSERGLIRVSARCLKATEWIEFQVADTGIGIPQESLSMIFEKFTQRDGSETRSYGGVGLGLYLVKAFAEMLGGTVEVESEVNVGSTFTVRLPCAYGNGRVPLGPDSSNEVSKECDHGTSRQAGRRLRDEGTVWRSKEVARPAPPGAFDKSYKSS